MMYRSTSKCGQRLDIYLYLYTSVRCTLTENCILYIFVHMNFYLQELHLPIIAPTPAVDHYICNSLDTLRTACINHDQTDNGYRYWIHKVLKPFDFLWV